MKSFKKRQTDIDKQRGREEETDRQADEQRDKNRHRGRKMVGWLVDAILWQVASIAGRFY